MATQVIPLRQEKVILYLAYILELIGVNILAFEIAISAAAAPYTDCQGFGVWSLLFISV